MTAIMRNFQKCKLEKKRIYRHENSNVKRNPNKHQSTSLLLLKLYTHKS